VIDIRVQPRRDRRATEPCFRKLLKGQGHVPRRLITDIGSNEIEGIVAHDPRQLDSAVIEVEDALRLVVDDTPEGAPQTLEIESKAVTVCALSSAERNRQASSMDLRLEEL